MIKKLTEIMDEVKPDCIYDILAHLDLDLCIDVGAARGEMTGRICLAGGKETRVVAFEPFPGNHQYFQESTKLLENDISLIKKAVSDSIGTFEFIVHSVVQGGESGWEEYVGYSSVGFLSSVSKIDVSRWPDARLFEVETTTIDDEFLDEKIDFMKIDVQGAETQVLVGAKKMLKENDIHLMYIEWTGENGIIEILTQNDYQIYDSTYIVVPKQYDLGAFADIGFESIKDVKLSTGKRAYEMVLTKKDVSPAKAIQEVKDRDLGYIQTDLIVFSPKIEKAFFGAIRRFLDV